MPQKKLNQFYATAICGNDILSSTLYVSGIAILFAGVYAPFVLLFIALVLYFYKSVYQEVVEALPVNGGVYNCLLNATSKTLAAIAGIMIFFSYIATALLSARFGVEYLHTVVDFVPIMWGTFLLLFIFGLLVVAGLRNASKVAGVIFVFHLITLIVFVGAGVYYFFHGPSFFIENIHATQQLITDRGGIFMALYLAFSASLLGVSGFESSSNFVEEQKPGVFRKTLRNMLLGVAIFNPLIVLIVLNSMPIAGIADVKNFLLSDVAHSIGGVILQYLVAIDAFLVLSGAVEFSFTG
jgi:amino acid transporter